ncbi:hypothetical protein P5673_032116 [Acropora cervicornis]|uniref:Uncharacterized protein n=1 Tax=Acropora cervicornis TaxID=6130 RepID=A0AAD9PRP9_ACRCE|nr:hypothetical protein P5673_032116 [Acropora cervicornis]
MALQGNGANSPKKLKEILLAFLLPCNSSCPKTNKALVAVAFNDGVLVNQKTFLVEKRKAASLTITGIA